jgi:hypothetical protein
LRSRSARPGAVARAGSAGPLPAGIILACLLAGLVLAGLHPGLTPPAFCLSKSATASLSNQVPGVKPFQRDAASGATALRALVSSLEAGGQAVPYSRLAALSGAAFKFVYDTTDAYEPLQDLFPMDVLKSASSVAKFADAHWEMDQPIDKVKAIVKREIDQGHPVVAPFLKPDAYSGFFVIAGYDYAAGLFYLQGAFPDTAYVAVPIPASWSGPTASPMGWASNPIFVTGGRVESQPAGTDLDKNMVAMAIESLKGGSLKYGLTPGEQAYLGAAGGAGAVGGTVPTGASGGAAEEREAAYGIPAYGLLAQDISGRPLVVATDGVEAVNFAFLWRLDSQLGQLEQDRKYAADALDFLSTRVSDGKSLDVETIADNVDKTVADVRKLRKMFMDQIPYDITTADGLVQYVRASTSIVYSFAGRDRLLEDLRSLGLKAYRSRLGPVVVDDSEAKRMRARLVAKSIEARERATLRMLEEIVGFIGPDLGAPAQQEPPQGRRRKK